MSQVRPVQLILIVMLIAAVFLYFSRLRSGLMDRLVVLLFAIVGIFMAALPDVTTRIASLVGVGRGADLFMYLALVGLAFLGLVLYSRIRDLEATITDLARATALNTARTPANPSGSASGPEDHAC